MNSIELHRRAVAEFASRMDALGAAGASVWGQETPCDGWDVRTLVNHVTGEGKWTAPLLAGKTIADVGDAFEGDLLADDPVGAFASAGAEATAAASGVPESKIVHLSFGDVPASEYLHQLAADHLIHAWDLAAATEGDRNLDPEVVAGVADWFVDREQMYRDGGAIGPRADTTSDDPQDRLLVAFGREPRWHPRS